MSSFNQVILLGNLTFDPSLSYTPQMTAVTRMRIAVNKVSKLKSGTEKKETMFIDVQVWQKQAENCAEYLKKGSLVLVIGELKFDQWTDKEKHAHSKHYVVANRVQFLSRSDKQIIDETDEKRAGPEAKNPEAIQPDPAENQDERPTKDEDIPF